MALQMVGEIGKLASYHPTIVIAHSSPLFRVMGYPQVHQKVRQVDLDDFSEYGFDAPVEHEVIGYRLELHGDLALQAMKDGGGVAFCNDGDDIRLAVAVLRGDRQAALLLADLVLETYAISQGAERTP